MESKRKLIASPRTGSRSTHADVRYSPVMRSFAGGMRLTKDGVYEASSSFWSMNW